MNGVKQNLSSSIIITRKEFESGCKANVRGHIFVGKVGIQIPVLVIVAIEGALTPRMVF
jgi:hypothetical protein